MMDEACRMAVGTKLARRLTVSVLTAGLLVAACAAQAPRITEVDIEKFPDRVELTAYADSPMSYSKVGFPGKLHALGIEIPAVMEISAFHKRGIHSGEILSVRSVQFRSKPPIARLMASCSEPAITTVYELDGGKTLKLVVWMAESSAVPLKENAPSEPPSETPQEAAQHESVCVASPKAQHEMLLASLPASHGAVTSEGEKAVLTPPDKALGWSGSTMREPLLCGQGCTSPRLPEPEHAESASGLGAQGDACADLGRFAVDMAAWAVTELMSRCQAAADATPQRSVDRPTEEVASYQGIAAAQETIATPPPSTHRQEKLASRPAKPMSQAAGVRPARQEPPVPPADHSADLSSTGQPKELVAAVKQEMVFELDGEGEADAGQAKIDLDFVDSEIVDVLKAISIQSGVNVVAGPEVQGKMTLTLTGVTVEEALNYVAKLSGYQYAKVGRAYVVGTPAGIRAVSTEPGATSKTSVFSLRHVTPDTVIAVLSEQLPGLVVSTGAAEGVQTVIVTGPEADVEMAREIIEAIDSAPAALSEGWFCEVYITSHADPLDLIRILGELVPNAKAILGPTSAFKGGQAASAQGKSSLISSGDTGPATAAPAAGGAPPAPGNGGGVSVQTTGPASNMLILTGPEDALKRAKGVLENVDVPQKQVLIQVKITDIALDDSKSFGFQWSWSQSSITEMVFSPTGEDIPNMAVMGQDYTPWHFRRTPQAFTVMMDALFQTGEAKLLANPSVAVLNNHEASFFIGDKILYPVIAGVSQGTTLYDINSEEVGIGIDVAPQIGDDGNITLYIHPYVSSITGYLQTPQGSYPQTARRETQTTIMVKDGETIVIGGLLKDNEIRSLKKFPILGDLPLLGEIFRHRTKQKIHSEVMIMITCEIIGE